MCLNARDIVRIAAAPVQTLASRLVALADAVRACKRVDDEWIGALGEDAFPRYGGWSGAGAGCAGCACGRGGAGWCCCCGWLGGGLSDGTADCSCSEEGEGEDLGEHGCGVEGVWGGEGFERIGC